MSKPITTPKAKKVCLLINIYEFILNLIVLQSIHIVFTNVNNGGFKVLAISTKE